MASEYLDSSFNDSLSESVQNLPQTPPLSASAHRDCLDDSPFSDYYTDSSRSSANFASTDVQKDLMRRLNILGSLIQRAEPTARCARLVHSRLDGVEAALAAPDPQSRLHLEDSGLFLEDDESRPDEKEIFQSQKERELVAQHEQMSFDIADRFAKNVEEHLDYMNHVLDEAKQREQCMQELLDEARDREASMQEFADNVEASSKGLKCRLDEVKQMNSLSATRIDVLKMENTCLRSIRTALEDRVDQCESENEILRANITTVSSSSPGGPLESSSKGHWKLVPRDNKMPDDKVDAQIRNANMSSTSASSRKVQSRWSAFWGALDDSVGLIDYYELMHDTARTVSVVEK